MSVAPGFPADAAQLDAAEGRVSLLVDAELYPREVVYAAVMPMLSKAFVMLDRAGPSFRIEMSPRDSLDAAGLRGMLGGLANELLVAASRAEIAKRRGGLLQAVTARAVHGAMGPPTLDDLESFDLDGEAFEDPLGIAASWERGHAGANEGDEG